MITKIKIRNFMTLLMSISLVIISLLNAEAAPGDLDLTFGVGGKVLTQTGYDDKANAAAIQADGKIVIAGERRIENSNYHHALLSRYNPDGSLDTSFGSGGFVTDAAHGGHPAYYKTVAVQADGKIVAAGYFFEAGGCTGTRPWIVRYNADGSRDMTFGYGGAFEFFYDCSTFNNSYGHNYGIAIQNNGKIVVAGSAKNASGKFDFAAARLNTDGTLDSSFNFDGMAMYSISDGDDEAFAVAFHARSGRIVLAGYSSSSTVKDFTLVALTSQGLLDFNFGAGGKVTTNTGGTDVANAVKFQTDGKIIAAGRQSNGVNTTDFSLARYNTNGSLDTSFGGDGKVATAFSASYDAAFGIGLQSDGKIVAAGFGADNNALETGYNFALSRYVSTGALDAAFGTSGKQMTDFFNYQDHARAVVIQTDGKIVVAGYSSNGSDDNDIALARYLP